MLCPDRDEEENSEIRDTGLSFLGFSMLSESGFAGLKD
jgi:hypothetical protein